MFDTSIFEFPVILNESVAFYADNGVYYKEFGKPPFNKTYSDVALDFSIPWGVGMSFSP